MRRGSQILTPHTIIQHYLNRQNHSICYSTLFSVYFRCLVIRIVYYMMSWTWAAHILLSSMVLWFGWVVFDRSNTYEFKINGKKIVWNLLNQIECRIVKKLESSQIRRLRNHFIIVNRAQFFKECSEIVYVIAFPGIFRCTCGVSF